MHVCIYSSTSARAACLLAHSPLLCPIMLTVCAVDESVKERWFVTEIGREWSILYEICSVSVEGVCSNRTTSSSSRL